MLTLTRKVGEDVVLELEDGQTIEVVVREIRRNQVRIGFRAPRKIQIHRGEIYEDLGPREEEWDE